jgi:signal transduction histidine kinase
MWMNDRPVRILLVEDDEDDYVLTRDLLAEIPEGRFELDWVVDVDQALEEMCSNKHDLFLIDYGLGRIDGLSLLKSAVERGCTAPIIILTGHGRRAIDLGAMQAGAADFLEKSRLDSALLDRSIRYCLEQKRHADELERRVRERTAELALANQSLQAEIQERARVEEALRLADRRKNEFLAMLAHELRNPLVPIRNALEIMRLMGNEPNVVETNRSLIERQVRQLVRLIDDLVDVARISHGTIQLKREQVELGRVVASAIENARPLIDNAGHDLAVSLPDEPIFMSGDPTRLAQVLQNLLNNAARYMERKGRIWLSAEREAEEVVLRVKDQGIGIPPAMLEQIFDMFAQVDRPREQARGGLGIGLSLVKTLVELHGGTVKAYSSGPGQGSEFVVRLPLAGASGDRPDASFSPS